MAVDTDRQIVRQWRLLQKLAANRRAWGLAELHTYIVEDGYPCVERTVYRDLNQLHGAGFPLVKEDGRWRYLESDLGQTKTVRMTEVEMISMLIAQESVAGTAAAGPFGDFFRQVSAMFGPQQRAFVETLKAHIQASPHAVVVLDPEAEQLRLLTAAINGQRVAKIVHRSPSKGESARDIEPYLLWHAKGGLYVVAHDHRSGQIRTFAVQRIVEVELLDQRFIPDPTFNPAEHTRRGFGVFNGDKYRFQIEFRRDIAYLITERQWHHTQRECDTEWGVMITWHMAGLREVASWIAGFGGQARIHSPAQLINLVREIHQSGLDENDGQPVS